jgi:DNA primase
MTGAEAAKQRIDAKEVLSRIGITEVVGQVVPLRKRGAEYVGLCPFHAEKTPSFTVVPKKGFCKCFGCGKGGDAIEFLKLYHGISYRDALEQLASMVGLMPRDGVVVRPRKPMPQLDERKEQRAAENTRGYCEKLWSQCQLIGGGVFVERYLWGRGIHLEPLCSDIRLHNSLPYEPKGECFRAMVAAIRDVEGRMIGLHRTFLDVVPAVDEPVAARAQAEVWPGCETVVRKARVESPKKMLGQHVGGAVRLAEAAPVLALAEGIETSFSVMQSTGIATWAALSLNNLATVVLPPVVEEVVICADSDMKDMAACEAVIQKAVARYQAQGKRVRVARAAAGMDFNDMLLARYRAG